MSEEGIPQEVKGFIADHIDSVLQLELLLLLHQNRGKDFDAGEVVKELRIDAGWAASQLDHLCAAGIVACAGSPPRYHFSPRTTQLDDAVTRLAKAYSDRRVSVIGLIFSKPADKLRSFADAFRVRKEKTDG